MAGKKITELTQANAVADTDLFIVETNDGTKAVPYSGFKSKGSNVSFNGSGVNSIAVGELVKANGISSIAVGKGARANGDISIAVGEGPRANGVFSIAVGESVKANGEDSIGIGTMTVIEGLQSIGIGYNTMVGSNYSVALGSYAQTSNANSIQLGDSQNLSSITAKVPITTTSDERDKTDITEFDNKALEFINKIKAIRYVFNGRKLYIDEENLPEEEKDKLHTYGMCEYDREAHAQGTKKGSRMRVGVSAQNIQQALIDVFGDSGYANLVNDNLFDYDPDEIPEGVESQLAVNYEGFIPFLIKAVQELSTKVKELENK